MKIFKSIVCSCFICLASAILLLPLICSNSYGKGFYKKEGAVPVYTNIPQISEGFIRFNLDEEWAPPPVQEDGFYYSDSFDGEIKEIAGWFDVDPNLVKAIIKVESNFDRKAVSKKGARGIMQIMPETGRLLGLIDPFDPKDNIFAGVKHVSRLMNLFGNDLELVLAAYNAGENAVVKYDYNIPPFRETIDYVEKVKLHYGHLSKGSEHGI